MDAKKPYAVAIVIQVIYTGMFVLVKAALNQGFSTFVLVFYCQAAACLPLVPIAVLRERRNMQSMSLMLLSKLFLCALIGNTFSINLLTVSLKYTSATVQSAISNSKPVLTFCLALLLRMEVVKMRSSYGIAKVTGVALCLAGVLVIAFFTGPSLSPVNHHRAFHGHTSSNVTSRMTWIKGTFLKLFGDMSWALWIIVQSALLKEYPNRMLVTVTQCVFGTVQTLVVAAVAERDIARWKLRLDITLVTILYCGFVVSGLLNYLQVWCMEMKGPVFLAIWCPLGFVFTMFCSSFFLGEVIHLGSILGGILLTGGLYSVLWAKSKETTTEPCSDEVNTTENAQDEKEETKLEDDQKKGNKEEQEEEVSAYAVQQV